MSSPNFNLASESEENFARLLEQYQSALLNGTLPEFWTETRCTDSVRQRLTEIGSAISEVELYFASAGDDSPSIDFELAALQNKFADVVIQRELGRGNNGVVYLAHDVRLNRSIAIKIPSRHLQASLSARHRFRQEAELAAGVDHPHILPIYKIGSLNGLETQRSGSGTTGDREIDYIISAYCPGPNLKQWMNSSSPALTAHQVAELILRLAEGLEACHLQNILHRDIKPANVMLFPISCGSLPFWPKLTDFGLAKSLDSAVELTAGNEWLGTPRYMAVEQISNSKEKIGTATDVYALGVLLYELLAGKPPFDAEDLPLLFDQIRASQPMPIRSHCSSVSPKLEAICMKCLRKNPEQRYPTAATLADDLRRFLGGQPLQADRQSRTIWWQLGSVWCRLTEVNFSAKALHWSAIAALVGAITLGIGLSSRKMFRSQASHSAATAKNVNAGGIAEPTLDGCEFSVAKNQVFVASLPDEQSKSAASKLQCLTVETWICPDYPRGMVLNFGGVLSLFSDDGQPWSGPSINLMLPNRPMVFLHSETLLKPRQWSHLAFVLETDAVEMFVNGQPVKLLAYTEDASGQRGDSDLTQLESIELNRIFGNRKLSIGGNFPSAMEKYSYPFTGSIAHIRISNFRRYSGNFIPARTLDVDSGTLLLYRFDSETVASVADLAKFADAALAYERTQPNAP